MKTPKTDSSVRKVFLPKSVAKMLIEWKEKQDETKDILGDEYMDYNLVMASTFGLPLGDGAIRKPLNQLINAELFEEAFYEKKDLDPQMHPSAAQNIVAVPEGIDAEMLAKVLSNPEMAALLTSLAKTMK